MLSLISLDQLINGVITGLITSFIFLFCLWNLKPSFTISKNICREKAQLNGVDTILFYFKIINNSIFFKVYEVKVKAFLSKEINNLNGSDTVITQVPINFNSLAMVHPFNIKHWGQTWILGDKDLKSRTNYAAQFFTQVDLKQLLNENGQTLSFQVMAKHSLTGYSIVQTMTYRSKLRVENGKFLCGNSCKIVDNNNQPATEINTN